MAFAGKVENDLLVVPPTAPEPENIDGLFIVHHLFSDGVTQIQSTYSRQFMVGFRQFKIESEHPLFSEEWRSILRDIVNRILSAK